MSDISSATTGAAGAKTLWVAIGVLGAAVVGLGGALYYQQTKQAPESTATVPVAAPQTPAVEPAHPAVAEKAAPAPVHKPAARTSRTAAASGEPRTATGGAAPVESKTPAARPVCVDCATVTAVTPIEREGQASGTGAVAGGVLGAIVGNQVGQGQGKDVATILGAIGGGIAGNQVEKKMKKVTVYQVELRMDDGGRRTLELAEPAAVGARVRVDGNVLSPLSNSN